LWEPPSASVLLDGVDICDLDVLSVRCNVGILFQLPSIFEIVVADNVHDNDVYKLLALANCDSSFFNKSGGELSIGQAQRAALARTLANEPGITYRVNFGTNIIKQIQRIADVVCLLVDGEIVEILKPDQLSTHPTAQRFLQLSS
ncbi:ABC transporter I family member 17, partial [Olea europaea subsp. europaea]